MQNWIIWPSCLSLPSPGLGDAGHSARTTFLGTVDEMERLLRRLALNDEGAVGMVLAGGSQAAARGALRPKVDLLVRLGALVALSATTTSLRTTVDHAVEAGATEEEIVGVLVAVAPSIGLARVVSTAPKLALAMGYEIEADESAPWATPS